MSSNPSASPRPTPGAASVGRTAPDRTIGSRADVATGAPVRYAKQLISHLGRKVPFTGDATTSPATAVIGEANPGAPTVTPGPPPISPATTAEESA